MRRCKEVTMAAKARVLLVGLEPDIVDYPSDEVGDALIEYRDSVPFAGPHVICTERSLETSPQAIVNMFQRWYRHLGFVGCFSHSGRRTFITNAARKISTVGGSLRDVQMLAGHANLRTTERYIDPNPEAQVRIVELV
jgi:integrase/recombinase XerD